MSRDDEVMKVTHPLCFSAGIGRTGTFIVIDILIDVIREKGEYVHIGLIAAQFAMYSNFCALFFFNCIFF